MSKITSKTPYRLVGLLLTLSCFAAACADDGTASTNNETGWKLNNKTSKDMPSDTPTDTPTDTPIDSPPPVDMRPDVPPPVDMRPDVPPPVDMTPDITPPVDIGPDLPPVPDMSGGCNTNNDCARSEVCCMDFNQQKSCKPSSQCAFGGVCANDNECSGRDVCCDFSQFGTQTKVCTDRCMGMNTGCTNNTECGMGEVCCPSLQGAAACKPAGQCQGTGGLCAAKPDCLNNQECCGFGPVMVCLDQCGF